MSRYTKHELTLLSPCGVHHIYVRFKLAFASVLAEECTVAIWRRSVLCVYQKYSYLGEGMTKKSAVMESDGRRLRSQQSKQAMVDAALALQEEGVLVPTALQIAERAGVGVRTFFRHFDDMEALFEAVDSEARSFYHSPFQGGDREGTLDARIEHLVEQRAHAYETIANVILSTHALLWRSELLRANYARAQRNLRKDLLSWLPELTDLDRGERAAIEATISFEMWNRLRQHQNQGKKASIEIVTSLLRKQLL